MSSFQSALSGDVRAKMVLEVGVMTDEQLRFLAQMHRGFFNESSEHHIETLERMDKREAPGCKASLRGI